jgi:two-component system sensor histidine kinase CreC
VQGDRLLLYQAIANLIQNAIEFSPAGGQIQVRCETEDDDILKLIVEDHGVGIPEYATVKVFDKFFSLQRPDSGNKSTGLGLNFVQEVTILHNGEIKLENRSKKGARATLSLPLYKP